LGGDLAKRIAVARGDARADLVLRDARVVDVFLGDVVRTSVAVCDGHVAGVGDYADGAEVVDLGGAWLAPGLIDAHMHMESSLLPPGEFARLAVPRGTTAVVIDPHEIANVLGVEGVRLMLGWSEGLPLGVFVMAPSCVPATHMETSGAELGAADLAELMDDARVVGLAEMMNFPGVVHADPEVLAKVETGLAKRVDGHSPGLRGRALQAYAGAGISTDHECTTADEAREKLRAGMCILIREGTAAKNLEALLPLVTEATKHRFCFCTDDRHPHDIAREGHIDHVVRKAITLGLSPVSAIQMATIFPARQFGLAGRGAIAPGYRADFVVLDTLDGFDVRQVWAGGRLVAERGRYLAGAAPHPAHAPRPTVRLPEDLSEASFAVAAPADGRRRIRVIGMQRDQITTTERVEDARVVDGHFVADVERDLLRLAVIERHRGSGRIGLGFIHGFGLRRGAVATTVGHDSHNLCVLGAEPRDMLAAARALEEAGGGQVVVRDGEVRALLPLPIAGLMSDLPAEELMARQTALYAAWRELGSPVEDPFMTLSFMPLAVIPKLKLTDRGLVDVDRFALVPLVV